MTMKLLKSKNYYIQLKIIFFLAWVLLGCALFYHKSSSFLLNASHLVMLHCVLAFKKEFCTFYHDDEKDEEESSRWWAINCASKHFATGIMMGYLKSLIFRRNFMQVCTRISHDSQATEKAKKKSNICRTFF